MRDEELTGYLKAHCPGAKGCISGSTLARSFEVSENELRRRINRLRRQGIPIASNRSGYFYAANAGEVYSTIRQLKGMEDGLHAAIAGLEKALESFGGGDT